MAIADQFLNYAQLIQNSNQQLGADISGAVDLYAKMRMQKEANLAAAREKEIQRQLEAKKASLDPVAIRAKALQFGEAALTPEERATYQAAQEMEAAQVGTDQYGNVYRKFIPVPLGSQGMVAQPDAGTEAGRLTMQGMGLLPPSVAEEPAKPAPASPGGYVDEKVKKSAGFDIKPTSPVAASSPGQMAKWNKELEFYSNKLMKDYETGLSAQADASVKSSIEQALKRMGELNKKMKKKGIIVSEDQDLTGRLGAMSRGAEIPIPFGENIKIGKSAEKGLDPESAKIREEYARIRSMLFPFYAKASGLTATAIDTEKAREDIMASIGDPYGQYEANKAQLANVSRMIGTGDVAREIEARENKAKEKTVQKKQTPSSFTEGQTATNPRTGEKMIYMGGTWRKM